MPPWIARLAQIAVLILLLSTRLALGQSGQPQAGNQPQVPGPQQYPQTQVPGPVQQGPAQPPPQQGAPVQGPPRPPQAPFQLTPQQHAELNAVLQAWEQRSRKITSLSCTFTRWDYDPVFGMKDPQNPNEVIPKESKGVLKYAAPDKGLYRIEEITECLGMEGGQKKFATRKEGGEHWVCDGVSIWEYNYDKEQLIERRLPAELRGKAIADGPLPFLFQADAQKLQHRYFLRLVTPPNMRGQIWLEAYPKYAMDAANFRRATLILDQKTMLPFAIELSLHDGGGKARQVHQFSNNLVNNLFRIFQGDFAKPALPRGWTKVEEPAQSPPLSSNQPPKRG
jgi:TIGR03009 family protein